jgi:acetoin utilization deacetylase AcuC-like enzyme
LLRAHSREHVEAVARALENFDTDTPFYPNIEIHARLSAGAAIEATRSALRGETSFSLMRPPGHHATQDRAMGFCYFNNIAIAALDALTATDQPGSSAFAKATADQSPPATARAERIAIWDFDGHHGNGTEAIAAHHEQIRFASIHQSPAYPGTGAKSFANIHNYPIAPYTPRERILEIARESLEKLTAFEPDLLLVSAGFDAYARDPLLQLTLEREDFATLGEWLNEIDIPVSVALEGGYSNELPDLIDAFLTAWQP